jgi:hypothetical protein
VLLQFLSALLKQRDALIVAATVADTVAALGSSSSSSSSSSSISSSPASSASTSSPLTNDEQRALCESQVELVQMIFVQLCDPSHVASYTASDFDSAAATAATTTTNTEWNVYIQDEIASFDGGAELLLRAFASGTLSHCWVNCH